MGYFKKLNILLFIIYFTGILHGYSTERKIGDVMQLALPITALTTTYCIEGMEDYVLPEGTQSFLKSYFTTISMTYLIKEITQKRRPDGSDYLSFPSGHTSSAFAGASFIHFRYGLKYSIPLYLLASFTGYSRIESKKHYIEDVVAGAGLAIFNSWYFTSPYNKKHSFNLNYDLDTKTIYFNLIKIIK